MHDFFRRGEVPSDFELPRRAYALLIDAEDKEYALFDAVDAQSFDDVYSPAYPYPEPGNPRSYLDHPPGSWRRYVERAPIYAIEINALEDNYPGAKAWHDRHPLESLPEWSEIDLELDPKGEAAVYNNIAGLPLRARVSVRPVSKRVAQALERATDLSPHIAAEADMEQALPKATIDQIFALDVGQGSANALVSSANRVVAYVDLGAGVLADKGTWPTSPSTFCFAFAPTVILTHWHYDHFEAANIFPQAQTLTWIAPLQKLGPGPQSAMASALTANGTLMIWNGTGLLHAGKIDLERCTGPAGNQNRTGIAAWIHGPVGSDPIVLPGDAGYADVPGLARGAVISSLVVAHHGGHAPGTPPLKPGVGTPRAAFSYGCPNGYNHPLPGSLSRLTASKWTIGHPAAGVDERRTEDRPGGKGGLGLGHIRMNWTGNTGPVHGCSCGCTLNPTQ